jgi:rhamnogalacturonyl hydrolase YesR
MACPLLAAFGKEAKQPAWVDDAANQIIVFAKYLQDDNNGLFYHVYDWDTKERTPSLWARGNGWVLMSIADTMEVMGRGHKHYAALRSIAARMAAGLAGVQNADGMFHTVLDDPSSYRETSATMMFTYGLLKLVRLKVLPAAGNVTVGSRAWKAVNERYVQDGVVTGVSAGTRPGDGANYKARPVGRETWGTGAYLMAGYEVDRLR